MKPTAQHIAAALASDGQPVARDNAVLFQRRGNACDTVMKLAKRGAPAAGDQGRSVGVVSSSAVD